MIVNTPFFSPPAPLFRAFERSFNLLYNIILFNKYKQCPMTQNEGAGGVIFRLKLLLPWVLALMLPACSVLSPRIDSSATPLLAPSTLGGERSALQVLHGAFGEHELAFQCVVDANAQQVTLVGLSAQGQRLFSLSYDGRTLKIDSGPQAPAQLDPQRVLADLQLALWPLAALQDAFKGSAWQVSEPAPATRRLAREGRLVAEVHYASADPWRGRLWLSNFELGYSLAVESQALP